MAPFYVSSRLFRGLRKQVRARFNNISLIVSSLQGVGHSAATHGQPRYHLILVTAPKYYPEKQKTLNSNNCPSDLPVAECQQCEGLVVLLWQY